MTDTDFRSLLDQYVHGSLDREAVRHRLEAARPARADAVPVRPATAAPLPDRSATLDIAVIGMAGQFPGAADVAELWRNLTASRVAVGELPDRYLAPDGRGYRWGGALPDRDAFDAGFFGITAIEADSMNPHQRLLLQESWHALEDAGYDPTALRGSPTGVFVGAEPAQYLHETLSGASDAIVASRLSYHLDLRGPALAVDTACASGLVAVDLACRSLRDGETSLALAGGVHASLDHRSLKVMEEAGMLSASGRCRTFDAAADGTVISEAVAVLVLKRLADADRDGDHIYGVIRASGTNQDGASNGITAPNGAAQEQLITDVYRRYGIDPERITYVEAHGTATPLGDPVEAGALVRAFCRFTTRRAYCAVGSAKAHLGHAAAASGPVGLIKVLLSLRHGRLVGLPGFDRLNPLIALGDSPFVLDDARPWPAEPGRPRMAAVSSFGHSGTNAHLVIEEHVPAPAPDAAVPDRHLVPLSARTPDRLRAYAARLAAFLEDAATEAPASAPAPVSAAGNGMSPDRLRQLLADVLEVEPGQIAEDEPFSALGVDPGHLARLEALLEAEPGTVHRARSLTELARLLAPGAPEPDAAVPDRPDLATVAHTLRHGREAMDTRAAFVVRDLDELIAGLKAVAAGETGIPGCYQGEASESGALVGLLAGDEDLAQTVGRWLAHGKLDKAAELWAHGVPLDGSTLHPTGGAPRKVPLPGYPFAREYHGKDRLTRAAAAAGPRTTAPAPATTAAPAPVPDVAASAVSAAASVATSPSAEAPLPSPSPQPTPEPPLPAPVVTPEHLEQAMRLWISELISDTIGVPAADIAPDEPLDTYGVDSLARTRMNHQLALLIPDASRTLLFEFATVAELAAHLATEFPAESRQLTDTPPLAQPQPPPPAPVPQAPPAPVAAEEPSASAAEVSAEDAADVLDGVAVIGVSARFPGAEDLDGFWANLVAGHTAAAEIPPSRWDWREYYDPAPTGPDRFRKSHSKWGAFLDRIEEFDPLFFGVPPQEARNIDPQERLFLQECWKAMEDAGCSPTTLPDRVRRRTGVFAGGSKHGFERHGDEAGLELPRTSFGALVNRVSYQLDLGGPSQPVDTACSSALVAIHDACASIRRGECDLALAGGVNLYLHHSTYSELAVAQMLSDRPDCAAFGSEANGILPGEGVGAAVLKSYRQAVRDGDHVYAVIRGTAVNHSGRGSSFTAPSPQRQAEVIRAALDQADIDPRTIGYVETAVNGSVIGDAVEMTGLTQVFGGRTGASGRYLLGTVKPNVGHGEASSGMSQLIKVLFALKHRVLPTTLLPRDLNPAIDFARLPFEVPRAAVEWTPVVVDGVPAPLRAGINGVGAGGVNAHLVLEEPPAPAPLGTAVSRTPAVFPLSVRTPDRLAAYVDRWLDFLDTHPDLDLAAVAHTLRTGREAMRHRLAVVASDLAELRRSLRRWADGDTGVDGVYTGDAKSPAPAPPGTDPAALARAWVSGAAVDWPAHPAGRAPVHVPGLPTYPFEPRRCWADAPAPAAPAGPPTGPARVDVPEPPARLFSSFAPFPERVPGFSASRVLLGLSRDPKEEDLVLERQRELRAALLRDVPLDRMGAALVLGCGRGDDVVDLAARHPRLLVHGVTADKARAEAASLRIEERGLAGHAAVFHAPGPHNPLPATYDLALGIEAVCRVEDKDALLAGLDAALVDGAPVLLADYVARLRGDIVDRDLGFHVPSARRWASTLARHRLAVEEIVDLSPQIARFLDDPEVERNTVGLPAAVRAAWRSFSHQAVSLEHGWLAYCLFRLRKDARSAEAELLDLNARRITEPVR
ncbi:beta-ketoacyl synthase N-terminal-like domain-containing protein [Streptomyces coffeae]|uniref:Ketosynthase family 3 (KS3) domain-containing protein n=1 Tax=Streptomyces coffeae TaxID=621382 RepID=A0ABS1NKQ0_9ACTN|nr:beta-ketoacyl synthase N-terminal-like domain-containing protein [Streptomyces coffeae]MBL1100573.1 hypothetical protein [Streptomyces coffeae]